MAASSSDYFKRASSGSTRPVPTTLAAIHSSGGTTITCVALTGWATSTGVAFAIYTVDTSGNKVTGSQTDWVGVVSGSTITNMVLKGGTDQSYSIGAIVEAGPIASYADDIATGMLVGHNQDGTHLTDLPLTTPKITTGVKDSSGNTIIPMTGSSSSTSIKLSTTTVGPTYVESGCVWSGDSYASTRNASMTAGVIYINGVRLTVAAVTARSFTASRDVYVDFTDSGSGTATITYIDNTTNAASPALTTAGATLRDAIVVVGATNIAAAASINQGQTDRVLPIASSIPYAVTDSIGNLIYNTSPNPTTIGYRQITTSFTQANNNTLTDVTGLSVPVIVPTGRKIRITAFGASMTSSGAIGTVCSITISESGTQLALSQSHQYNSSGTMAANVSTIVSPTAGLHTYNVRSLQNAAGTYTLQAGATSPAYISVELVQ